MRIQHLILPVLTGSLLLAAAACSDDDSGSSNNNSTGGTTATGGTNSTGGTTATGGTNSTGGAGTGGTGGTTVTPESMYKTAEEAGLTVGLGTYNYFDMGGSTVALTVDGAGKICGAGTAAQVVDAMYSLYWGGGIAVQLAEETGSFDASAYDGFSFTLEGKPTGELRIGITTVADPNNAFFTTAVQNGENTLLWSDLAQGTWVTAPVDFDASAVRDIQFQVASNDQAAVTFDFCVSNVKFVGDGTGMGGMGGGPNP